MENKIDVNEIVKIESMAVIKSQLDKVETFIDEKVKDIPNVIKKIKNMSFIEQEDEKKDIKKYQQYLSKLQLELENKRKEIKNEINKPYEEFNEYYTNGVYAKLDNGIKQIKEVVNEIEDLQKDEKRCELYDFAMEYIAANDIQDFITFDDIGLNITLSASMKSLKEQIIAFCEKVKQDVELIRLEEYSSEILYSYMNTHNFAQSKMEVIERHKALDELAKKQVEEDVLKEEQQKVVEKVEEVLVAPKEIIEDDEIISVTFTINDTKENIVKVREFMKKEGIKYE